MTDDIDFFTGKIAAAEDPEARVHLLNKACAALYLSSPARAYLWAEEALRLSTTLGSSRHIAESLFNLGISSNTLGRFREALAFLEQALDRYRAIGEALHTANTIANIGLIHYKLANYSQALDYYEQSLQQAEVLDHALLIGRVLNSIGITYERLGDYYRALDYYTRSLAVREQRGDTGIGPVLNNIANIHLQLGNDDVALDYYRRSLQLCMDTANDYGRGLTLGNIAEVYLRQQRYDEALHYQLESLAIFTASGNREMQANILTGIGKTHQHTGDLDTALEYQMQAQDIARSIEKRHTDATALSRIGAIYRLLGQHDDALSSLQEALHLATAIGARPLQLEILDLLARVYEDLDQPAKALEHLRTLMNLCEEEQQNEQRQMIDDINTRYEVEQVQREKELYRQKNAELADALREVEQLNAHLQALGKEKTEVLSIVTHELRNPLTGILASVSLLKEYIERMSEQEVTRQLGRIEETVRRSSETIDHLLNITAIESGALALSLHPLPLAAVAEQVAAQYSERAAQKKLTLRYLCTAPDTTVAADHHALYEVLDNLLSNAVKYSPPHTTVTIAVGATTDAVYCAVRDEGPGISAASQPKLFHKFSRLGTKPTGGEHTTGLGLYIVRKLTAMMNATVRCDSEEGHGAVFTVAFPPAAPAHTPLSAYEQPSIHDNI